MTDESSMSDESKTEFQLWAETEFINGPLQFHGMYLGWHARNAEIEALKARVAELTDELEVIKDWRYEKPESSDE